MNVLFLASEAAPFVKVGGLGDVAGSLPHALRALPEGIDIRLVIPFHSAIDRSAYDLRPVAAYTVAHAVGPIPAEVFETRVGDLPAYLIAGPPLSSGAPVYSTDHGFDGHKYTFFSLAALELPQRLDWQPEIVHANDWHTAPAVYSLSLHRQREPFFARTATLLTVHNLPYLGAAGSPALGAFGLPPAHDSRLPDWAQHLPLPLGLLTADHINTVSPGYAQEILTPEFGSGLHEFLQTRAKDISGILNGLDLEAWNPETDPALKANFSSKTLPKRRENKLILQRELGLKPGPQIPLLAMINRMDPQKGVDLVPEALRQITGRDWQVVILGTGVPEIETAVQDLENEFPQQVRAVLRFDGALARRIYAGADAMLIPSRYEPCGLTQMIAMQYGCAPIARATGGLRDTITDASQSEESTGFLFRDAAAAALTEAIHRALGAYTDQRRWQALQRRGMGQDFSWKKSARQYLTLYQRLNPSGR